METAEACWRRGEQSRAGARPEAAAADYRRVLALAPSFMPAQANLALVLGAVAEAEPVLRRALALAPGHPQLLFNLGNLLWATSRPGAAGAFRGVLALAPATADAWLNLGVAVHGEGRLGAAAGAAARVLALVPTHAGAWNNLANARRDQGLIEPALAAYDRALALRPLDRDAGRNRLAARLYVDDDEEQDGRAARAFVLGHAPARPPSPPPTYRRDGAPLRVGLLSSDLGDHPVGRNLAGFVAHRDASRIFLAAYDTGARRDRMNLWMRGRVDLWREVGSLDDAGIAGTIRADRIDVLVVLAGRFDRNRPLVAAWRPAPLQLTMHDGGPSGMGEGGRGEGGRGEGGRGEGDDPAIAARLTDRWLHPVGERAGGDRLLRLPVFYNFPKPERAPALHRPAAAGALRLGSFSNPAKLSARVLRCWGEILARLPEARLALKYRGWYGDPEVQARIRALVGEGAAARIDFVAAAETAEAHLARYADIDLALDPFPFSGAATSFEALAMGVPVLTLAGRAAIGRTTLAILGPLGLEELIAVSEADYVRRALGLARDGAALARLRREAPTRLAASPLVDGRAYAAALEAAFRSLL